MIRRGAVVLTAVVGALLTLALIVAQSDLEHTEQVPGRICMEYQPCFTER
jgi:hypothetical protein